MANPHAREVMFSPLAEYNKFASLFECEIGHEDPTWQEDFDLSDGSTLLVHGLNSTIVSDHQDDSFRKVVLGQFQVPLREPGVANLVMCHHPPAWWMDADNVEPALNHRASIELFGHKHSQRLLQVNGTLRLVAGAVHPSRQERQWRPCYNWLCVRVSGTGTSRTLDVDLFPRVWSEERPEFIPDRNSCDGDESRSYSLALEPWASTVTAGSTSGSEIEFGEPVDRQGPEGQARTRTEEDPAMRPARILTYRFFDLPHVVRMDVAQELDLIEDEDEGLRDFELFERVFRRARERSLLADLWEKVESRHGDGKYTDNPFSGS